MTTHTLATHPTHTDFKTLAQETGPCLSLYLSIPPEPRQRPGLVRATLQKVEALLSKQNLSEPERDKFLSPVRELLEPELSEDDGAESVGILRSLRGIWHFRLPYRVPQSVFLGEWFEVLPLVNTVSNEQQFYILALSQKHSRLIRCTLTSSEEVPLPANVPTNLSDFNQQDQPDHRLENRSQAGQKGKSAHPGQVVAFGTSSDSDQKDQYLHNFFRAMDRELTSFLRERPLLLIVAGVDYEIARYHSVSQYPELVPGGVQGAPDGLKGGDLHERALEVLKTYDTGRVDRALGRYEKAPVTRIARSLREIVPAAFDGRVLHLFVAEGFRQSGRFKEDTREAVETRDGDDLVNLAVLQTLAHGGDAFLLPPEKVPRENHIAALLRF